MKYEHFQNKGTSFLLSCKNIYELNKTYEHSCFICACTNKRLECEQCMIKQTYELLKARCTDAKIDNQKSKLHKATI